MKNVAWLGCAIRLLAAAGLAGSLVACAHVSVKKVPTPSQYSTWSDSMQKKADAMEGVRFYLPRPFVNVFESFPVSADVYFVNGMIAPGGEYVMISDVRADSPLVSLFASTLQPGGGYTVTVPSGEVRVPKAGEGSKGGLQGGKPGEDAASAELKKLFDEQVAKVKQQRAEIDQQAAKAKASAKSARSDANRASDAAAETAKPDAPQTGKNKRSVSNDNAAFAAQPLRGNFDLVYLPDFEEQYVVSSRANLGNAEFQLNLGQGWSLQSFNSLSDNSEINKRFFDLIDTSIEAAKAAAAGMMPGAGAASTLAGALQSGKPTEMVGDKATPVTLKIVVLHYAAKGLYPVLKPRELLYNQPAAVVIDPFDDEPRVRTSADVNDPTVRSAIARNEVDRGRYTVPVYPYQYISFNTFRYAAVEVVTVRGVPFGNLYDATGVTGSSGNARTEDGRAPGAAGGKAPPVPTDPPQKVLTDALTAAAAGSTLAELKNLQKVTPVKLDQPASDETTIELFSTDDFSAGRASEYKKWLIGVFSGGSNPLAENEIGNPEVGTKKLTLVVKRNFEGLLGAVKKN
ncbi:MAG: hypothetical protein ACOYN0_12760 [Phycisphaerales bacterium]